jgi:hypothetical protein
MQSLIKKLMSDLLQKWTRQSVVYWLDQPLMLTTDQWCWAALDGQPRPYFARIVILARKHYLEFVKTYPLTDKTELKAVLSEEYAEHPYVLHQFDTSEPNQTKVCSFVLSPAVISSAEAWVFFPETLLLATSFAQSNVVIDCAEQQFYLHSAEGLSVSQRHGPLCSTATMFSLNNGLPESLPVVQLVGQGYIESVLLGLKTCVLKGRSWGCWTIGKNFAADIKWRTLTGFVGGALALYLILVTLYMNLSIEIRQTAIAELGPGVNQLLDSQSRQQQLAQSYSSLSLLRKDTGSTAQVWSLVQSLVAAKVNLFALSYENKTLTIRGSAARATDVLSALLNSPYVKTAEFSAPVRNENGVEVFVIAIGLNDQEKTTNG